MKKNKETKISRKRLKSRAWEYAIEYSQAYDNIGMEKALKKYRDLN